MPVGWVQARRQIPAVERGGRGGAGHLLRFRRHARRRWLRWLLRRVCLDHPDGFGFESAPVGQFPQDMGTAA